jgi:1L-myo-inositol 1-phosphate cytidylyltransferase / CDP-L-myo-inositol myo-inositolphosphotransferase
VSEAVLPGTVEPRRELIGARSSGRERATPRVAVVLAAGRSERLTGVTGGGSKALVRVGGPALIERAVRTLLSAGLERVIVVVGYHAGPVAAVATRVAPGRVQTVLAERWELGNGASLAAVASHVTSEELFVLLTADHVFGDGALTPLITNGRPGVLVDPTPDPDTWNEGTRVRILDGLAVAFSKDADAPAVDCGAFLLPPAVFDAQLRAQARGDGSLAAAVTELVDTEPIEAVPLPDGSWWQDVDTREDLRRASASLRRSLGRGTDGPVSRYVNRPISTRLSMALAPLPIHPDAVSCGAFLIGLVGAVMLGSGHGIAGAVLVLLASILDGVDGEIARLQVRTSPGGALLDGVLDRLGDAAIVAGLGVWAVDRGSDPAAIVVLAVAATTGSLLSMATKDRITALGIPPAPERRIGSLLGGRDGRLAIIAIAALLGSPSGALLGVTLTSGVSLVARLLLVRADAS